MIPKIRDAGLCGRLNVALRAGNHFNEFAGFECDFTRYPGPDAQRFFLREYLAQANNKTVGVPGPPRNAHHHVSSWG